MTDTITRDTLDTDSAPALDAIAAALNDGLLDAPRVVAFLDLFGGGHYCVTVSYTSGRVAYALIDPADERMWHDDPDGADVWWRIGLYDGEGELITDDVTEHLVNGTPAQVAAVMAYVLRERVASA